MTPYDVLEVKKSDSLDVVRKAWINLVKQHHPDSGNTIDATIDIATINAAYDWIKNPTKKWTFHPVQKKSRPDILKFKTKVELCINVVNALTNQQHSFIGRLSREFNFPRIKIVVASGWLAALYYPQNKHKAAVKLLIELQPFKVTMSTQVSIGSNSYIDEIVTSKWS
jgi:DnaJ domain